MVINITSFAHLHLSLVRPDKQGEVLDPNDRIGLPVEPLAAELLSLQHGDSQVTYTPPHWGGVYVT